jgi:LysR family transcriptional activator of nhaA
MTWLNYHHLYYFWAVVRTGSIAAASTELRLAQPTISGQIHRLEETLGAKLLQRKGRSLVPTEAGRRAFRYADEIFALGQEFLEEVGAGNNKRQQMRLVVGVSDVLAKSVVHRILEPAFHLEQQMRVICREDRTTEAFIGELALHQVDVVLSDAPAPPNSPIRVFSHPLGECGSAFFASAELARSCRWRFPESLDGVPFLLPAADSTFRRSLNQWFSANKIRPKIIAELDDAALAIVLGEAGLGVFAAPDVVEQEIRRRYKVQLVGRSQDIRQRYYAISVERKIKHPAVAAICEVARKEIFS